MFALFVALSLAVSPSHAPPTGEAIAYDRALRAAAAAFAEREDDARWAEAIARYAEAAAVRPDALEPLMGLARAQAFRARSKPGAAREAWREVSRAAERAVRIASPAFGQAVDRGEDPVRAASEVGAKGAEPLYWLALAAMGMAQERGLAPMLAVKNVARGLMDRAAQLDERVDHGGPRRALGMWLATLPSAAGGGAAAARRELERARALAPEFQLTRVTDAQVLAVLLQDRDRFDEQLNAVMAFDDASAPAVGPENRLAKRLARELTERRERLF